ncbi:MAG: radical SAM protein [Spirochaetes bacterium]|nr:MAG: radical SAM protein [Spirochaetota bacterium]
MVIREIHAKTILSRSRVFDFTVNPYVGCQHGCTYCYARFMKRFTAHRESWGKFVDIKINAPVLLEREAERVRPGRVWISGVCDPYQPVEKTYMLTRKCLELLIQNHWQTTVQTKSPLVLRDMDLLKHNDKIEVGLSVTTGDKKIGQLFEPDAPSIKERITALEKLNLAGIKTFAMIAPLLPKAEELALMLKGKVDYILIDRMNYHYGDWVYRKYNIKGARGDEFFLSKGKELSSAFEKAGIECQVLY